MKKGKETAPVKTVSKATTNNDQSKIRKEQAIKFENYIHESGLAMGFQLIFSELISKKISPENYFSYVTIRLKEIGKELDSLKTKPDELEKNVEEVNIENDEN